MKKISNKLLLVSLGFFIGLPLLSLAVNLAIRHRVDPAAQRVCDRIADNDIHVVVLDGKKASEGMLYVQNGWHDMNRIWLNVLPEEISVTSDTLRIVLKDRSDVYQGCVFLADLKGVIRNGGQTVYLREH